jgi:chemotaxis protein histidine kinase CheA
MKKTNRLWILAALLVVAGGMWAVLFQTDLMPNQKAAVNKFAKKLLTAGRSGLIRGIVSGEDGFTALIDNQAVREGDSIYGVTVVKIYPDNVEFERNGTQWTQGLNEIPGRQWRAQARAKEQAQAKAQTEAEAIAQTEAEARAKQEAEAKVRVEAEARAQAEAEAKVKEQAETKAQAEAEAKAQAEAEARAKQEAEAKAATGPVGMDEAAQEKTAALAQQRADEARLPAAKDTQKRIAELISRLGDREPSVRGSVVATLEQIGPPAVAPLIAAMEDEDWIVRQGASQALGRIGDPQAVEPLIIALGDKNQWIRRYAAEALGLIGDEQTIEPLVAALKDDSPGVRTVAAKALESIRGFAAPQEQASGSKGKQAGTIIEKLIDLKIYVGAGIVAVLLLGGLTTALLRRRKSI